MDVTVPLSGRDATSTRPYFRHHITTCWLWMLVIINGLFGVSVAVSFFLGIHFTFTLLAISLVAFLIATGAYRLLLWKKSGFYLIAGGLAVHLLLNIITLKPNLIVGGLVNAITSLGLLYLVLQIGRDHKPWDALK